MLHGVRETVRLKMERLGGGTTRKMRCDGALAACLKRYQFTAANRVAYLPASSCRQTGEVRFYNSGNPNYGAPTMFLDTASLPDIEYYRDLGILKGITTNPTLLKQHPAPRHEQLAAILATRPNLLFVQVLGNSADALVEDFEYLLAAFPKAPLGIKVPINTAGMMAVKRMRERRPDVPLLGTAIYSAGQAILAGIAGCAYVAPYVNRMENNGIDPYTVIATSRRYYDNHAIDCRIVGASFKNTRQILHALDAGAHTCTLSPELLRQMLENAVANAAIRVFNADGGL